MCFCSYQYVSVQSPLSAIQSFPYHNLKHVSFYFIWTSRFGLFRWGHRCYSKTILRTAFAYNCITSPTPISIYQMYLCFCLMFVFLTHFCLQKTSFYIHLLLLRRWLQLARHDKPWPHFLPPFTLCMASFIMSPLLKLKVNCEQVIMCFVFYLSKLKHKIISYDLFIKETHQN